LREEALTTARITAFSPGQSPPLVKIPMRLLAIGLPRAQLQNGEIRLLNDSLSGFLIKF
jgi:hypothetical protein